MTKSKIRLNIILYIVIDIICVGAGMGVPIFSILLGFPVGWYFAKQQSKTAANSSSIKIKILKLSLISSFVTFILMAIIWGRTIVMLFNSSTDFKNFGHPFILYDPKVSFIGWLVLMILISPFLQLLTTIFGAFLALIKKDN